MNKDYIIILSYGLPAIPLSMLLVSYYLFLPTYYVSNYSASLSLIGMYLMLSRIFDAVTDPLIGWISDYFTSIGYSRSILMILGLVILMPSTYFLFNPETLNINTNVNFIIFSLIFFLALTLITLPYEAIGIEYTANDLLRSKMLSARDSCLLFGTILSSLVPYCLANIFVNDIERQKFLSILYLLMSLSFTLIMIITLKLNFPSSKTKNDFKLTVFTNILRNKNFILLLIAYIISSLGAALPASLYLFFTKHYLNFNEEVALQSLLLYFIIGFISVPFWLKLSNKYNKKNIWFMSQTIHAGAFLPVFFLTPDTSYLFNFLIFLSALGLGGTIIMPSILQALFINNFSNHHSNTQIQGAVSGVWSVSRKFSQGVGSGLGFYILSSSGFNNLSLNNSNYSILLLGILYALAPTILCLISIFIAKGFNYETK